MKQFIHKSGIIAGETMTVIELINELEKYGSELPVMATWEGIHAYITTNDFEIDTIQKGSEDECKCLVIDVEHH